MPATRGEHADPATETADHVHAWRVGPSQHEPDPAHREGTEDHRSDRDPTSSSRQRLGPRARLTRTRARAAGDGTVVHHNLRARRQQHDGHRKCRPSAQVAQRQQHEQPEERVRREHLARMET